MPQAKIELVKNYLLKLQDIICQQLEAEDSKQSFIEENWSTGEFSAGRSRVITDGKVFEQAGVNFSHVSGDSLPHSASEKRPELQGCRYQAMGISLVIHPNNPYVPTTHANLRFFMAEKDNREPVWWFGGGFDLTPYYPFKEDIIHWHSISKQLCDNFDKSYYQKFKEKCDSYFYLPHRKETRGVGGIFFDDFPELDNDRGSVLTEQTRFKRGFDFIKSVGDNFLSAYLPIVKKRKDMDFGQRQRDFQLYRRGRYVEFNLVFDRGTLFGLQTNGRTESILMSLPPLVKWRYNWHPETGSEEAKLNDYLKPQNWLE